MNRKRIELLGGDGVRVELWSERREPGGVLLRELRLLRARVHTGAPVDGVGRVHSGW